MRAGCLSKVLQGYGSRSGVMCHSGPSVRPSIHTNFLQTRSQHRIQDRMVVKSFRRPVRGGCCSFRVLAVHTCCYISSSAVIYIQSSGSATRTKGVQRSAPWPNRAVYSFSHFPFPDLVVDLGDGSLTAPALHQLVDGALAVTFEFVQVLVKDLTRTQR